MKHKIWALLGLLVAVSLAADESEDIRVGLKGYWPLNETSGSNLTDFTFTHNDGWFDVGSPVWVQGKFSNALEVSEFTFDRAVIPHHTSYNENNAYSISFWFTPISTYRNYNVFNKGAGKVGLGHSGGEASVLWQYFGSPWPGQLTTGVGHNSTGWHHFVIIYDTAQPTNEAKRVFVDGSLLFATNSVGIGLDSALNTDSIAFNHTDTGRVGSAVFDDLAIWSRSLTANEIAYLYNNGDGNIVAEPPPRGTVVILY